MSALFQHVHDKYPALPLLVVWHQVLKPDAEGPALIQNTVTDLPDADATGRLRDTQYSETMTPII